MVRAQVCWGSVEEGARGASGPVWMGRRCQPHGHLGDGILDGSRVEWAWEDSQGGRSGEGRGRQALVRSTLYQKLVGLPS